MTVKYAYEKTRIESLSKTSLHLMRWDTKYLEAEGGEAKKTCLINSRSEKSLSKIENKKWAKVRQDDNKVFSSHKTNFSSPRKYLQCWLL